MEKVRNNMLQRYHVTGDFNSNKKDAWCPACKYFGVDCDPDVEDYGEPCDTFELDDYYRTEAELFLERMERR